ncbi:hypothetical protein RRG08_052450 [Elysia crispata]|uniref:Uncharacterized protein n=1 Tax=Elysia crispata TaxID=231223 RepID=A0AAE1E881_9GAST|nr:hypothetical protein RRG08_052450 [Elysia crispata]
MDKENVTREAEKQNQKKRNYAAKNSSPFPLTHSHTDTERRCQRGPPSHMLAMLDQCRTAPRITGLQDTSAVHVEMTMIVRLTYSPATFTISSDIRCPMAQSAHHQTGGDGGRGFDS